MNNISFLLALCLAFWTALAADPQQPKVGGTTVIAATNGYAGTLTVRTQINLGLAGSEGALTTGSGGTQLLLNGSPVGGGNSIWSTNVDGTIQATSSANGTNVSLRVNTSVGSNSFLIWPNGSFFVGPNTLDWWGGPSAGESVIYYDKTLGDPEYVELDGYSTESATGKFGSFKLDVEPGNRSRIQLSNSDSTNTYFTEFHSNIPGERFLRWHASVNGSDVLSLEPTAQDTQTPYVFDTSVTHTSQYLAAFLNNRTSTARIKFDGSYSATPDGGHDVAAFLQPYALEIYANGLNDAVILEAGNDYFGRPAIGISNDGGTTFLTRLDPTIPDGQTPYVNNTSITHTSGNMSETKNNGTLKQNLTFDGVDTTVGGFSSSAIDSAVTIASTGWTNTFGKNAIVYLDGIGLTFKVANNAGTFVYTNSVALAGDSVLLQPNGKVIITGGTLGVGRATPF